MSGKRLRVSAIHVQPVLVWDDGEELHPGPTVDRLSLTPSQLAAFVENLSVQVAELAAQLTPPITEKDEVE